MQEHFWEEIGGYETKINAGFTELKPSAYTVSANDAVLDFRNAPPDKSNMARYLFGGLSHCLYSVWFRQLDLAPFDALIWPHPEGMGLVIPRGPWRKEPVGRLEPRPGVRLNPWLWFASV